MKYSLFAISALLVVTSCGGGGNDAELHAFVTCDPSWGSNIPSDRGFTKCESACESYIDQTNSDTCEGTLWDHTIQQPNTNPDGAAGCAGVIVVDGVRGCCEAIDSVIQYVVCDAGQ